MTATVHPDRRYVHQGTHGQVKIDPGMRRQIPGSRACDDVWFVPDCGQPYPVDPDELDEEADDDRR